MSGIKYSATSLSTRRTYSFPQKWAFGEDEPQSGRPTNKLRALLQSVSDHRLDRDGLGKIVSDYGEKF